MSLCVQSFSHFWLFAAPWTVACQAPLPMEFSRQAYWSGVPCPTPRDLPDPEIEPKSLAMSLLHWQAIHYHWRHLGSTTYSEYMVLVKILPLKPTADTENHLASLCLNFLIWKMEEISIHLTWLLKLNM